MVAQVDTGAAQRARRAVNGDGLLDIALGCGLAAGAAYVALNRLTDAFFLAPLVAILPGVGIVAVALVRRRVTWPRVGYARLRGWALPLAAIVILVGIAAFVLDTRPGRVPAAGVPPYLLAVYGGAGALGLALFGRRTGMRRFYCHAVLLALCAVVPWLLSAEQSTRLIVLLAAPGSAMAGGGALMFARFLRKYPIPAEADDVGRRG